MVKGYSQTYESLIDVQYGNKNQEQVYEKTLHGLQWQIHSFFRKYEDVGMPEIFFYNIRNKVTNK